MNFFIVNYFAKNSVDCKNKPLELNALDKIGGGLSPSMKATQFWCLLRFLPLVIRELVPTDNPLWAFLLHLSHLVDLIFAPKFTQGMIVYLEGLIEDHLYVSKFIW